MEDHVQLKGIIILAASHQSTGSGYVINKEIETLDVVERRACFFVPIAVMIGYRAHISLERAQIMEEIPPYRLLVSITGPSVTEATIRNSVSSLRPMPLSGIVVEPEHIEICHQILADSTIPIIGIVNYPLGLATGTSAVRLAQWCYEQKAEEILCGLPYGLLLSDISRGIEFMFCELLSLHAQRRPRVYLPSIGLSEQIALEVNKVVTKFSISNIHIGKPLKFKMRPEAISNFRLQMPPGIAITIETDGGMLEAKELLSAGADYVCLKTFGEKNRLFDYLEDRKSHRDG